MSSRVLTVNLTTLQMNAILCAVVAQHRGYDIEPGSIESVTCFIQPRKFPNGMVGPFVTGCRVVIAPREMFIKGENDIWIDTNNPPP